MFKRLLLAATLLAPIPAMAQPPMQMMGIGTQACQKFISGAELSGDKDMMSLMALSWAQGFMTAMNVARSLSGSTLKNLSGYTIEYEASVLYQYCRSHPQKQYADGVFALYDVLPDIPSSTGN